MLQLTLESQEAFRYQIRGEVEPDQAPDDSMQQLKAVSRKGVQLCNCAVWSVDCSMFSVLQLQFTVYFYSAVSCELECWMSVRSNEHPIMFHKNVPSKIKNLLEKKTNTRAACP